MTVIDNITFFEHSDISWPFDDSNRPFIQLVGKPYTSHETLDPFPCYSHDRDLVCAEVKRIESLVKFPFPVSYFVLPYETLGRTNGWASKNEGWGDDKKNQYPRIVLAGKRIPLHPAMTRYLVSHEAGHCIHYAVESFLNKEEENVFEKEYAEMRGIDFNASYGALKWHTNTGEVIANDIRIILFESEKEFWPHAFKHPLEEQRVIDFWMDLKKRYLTH